MEIEEFWRIPFPVKGVQVTEENMQEVANWCRGKLSAADETPRFIKVKVEKAITDKQTRARVGDYVLRSPSGFKVYTEQAFNKCFGKQKVEINPVTDFLETFDPTTNQVALPGPVEVVSGAGVVVDEEIHVDQHASVREP